jgi:hypothetical protein
MSLRCEMEEEGEIDYYSAQQPWLRAETFESLAELNEQCLELLADQATVRTTQPQPLLRELAELWRTLDPAARRRAAACPYLLLDAGFADASRWRWASGHHVHDQEPLPFASFFTVPRATAVARQIFTYAWHLARTRNAAARVMFGMPAHCANLVGACSLRQITELAERRSEWLRPRWPSRVRVWREFLLTAASGDAVALERARMHGLQLLAAESRAAVP